jgi:hypothetical protein
VAVSWAPGTIVVCIAHEPEEAGAPGGPVPEIGEHCTVGGYDDGHTIDLVEYPLPQPWGWARNCFRLAEGGQCEAERARAMKPVELNK